MLTATRMILYNSLSWGYLVRKSLVSSTYVKQFFHDEFAHPPDNSNASYDRDDKFLVNILSR